MHAADVAVRAPTAVTAVTIPGTFQCANGEEYIGDFYEGYEHGHGVHSWPDGTEYSGNWKNGKEDGEGTLRFSGGDTYSGDFKRGKRHGQGVITSLEGHKYVPEQHRGRPHLHLAAPPFCLLASFCAPC